MGRAAGLGGLRGELRDRARRPACRPHFRRRGCGMLIRTPTQARQKVADDVDRVRREFVVNDKRLHRWQRWLDDDSSWPDFSVVVHGDLYVGHVLIDNTERVSGMIDWSEARVDDPAIDMAAHLMVFGEEGLAKLLLTYEAAGGRVWPRLATTSRSALRSGGHLRTLRPRLG
nr:phosphotransferase [Escherichia coli]